MRLKIILLFLVAVLGVFLFVNTVQSPQPLPPPNIVQNAQQIKCFETGSVVSCDLTSVIISDDIYPNSSGLDEGLVANFLGNASVHTWHNETDIPPNVTIQSVDMYLEWSVTGSSVICSIEVYNGSWNTINSTCPGNSDRIDEFNLSDILTNTTLMENSEIRINHSAISGQSKLRIDHVFINITYLPRHRFDLWNMTNSSTGAVISNGQNFTRSDFFNASAHWLADGVLNSTLEHNGNWNSTDRVFVNYTLNDTGGFPENYTNYTINLSNTTEFPLAGNITVRRSYTTDIYGQLNSTQGIRYFYLLGLADVSNLSFSRGTILNGTNTTLLCTISDSNSSVGIPNYNVSFYRNESFIGTNLTNSSGISVFEYADDTSITNSTSQSIPFKCNITDQAEIFYNASVSEQSSNLSVVDVSAINLTETHSVYNRGENLTLAVLDTSNNSIGNITWSVNLTKFNESEQTVFNQTNDTFTLSINSTDPVGNWTLFANITAEGHTTNRTWTFNITNKLKPYFVVPTSTQFAPGSTFTPRLKMNYSRDEELDYLVDMNLTCSAGNLALKNTTDPPYGDVYKNTTECQAPSTFGASFQISVTAADSSNNTGSLELYLSTTPAQNGGGGGGGGTITPTCQCGEWTTNSICGFGVCSGDSVLQTRVCNPVDLCANETIQRCVETPACFGVPNFNFTATPARTEIIQGESSSVIVNIENTGDILLQIITTIETPLEVSGAKEFELLENESVEFPLNIHATLTQPAGEYIITLNISSGVLEKTKTIEAKVLENPLISRIAELEGQLSVLEEDIQQYKETGISVNKLEEEASLIRQALQEARRSIENDSAEELRASIIKAEEKIFSVQAKLASRGIEKFFAENMWLIIFGLIAAVTLTYLITQLIIPFYTLGRDIKSLSKQEKELVKARIETEKQYFRREIDEKTFHSLLTKGQGEILRARGSLKTKREFRSGLLKTRLSHKAVLSWFKKPLSKLKAKIKTKHAKKYSFKTHKTHRSKSNILNKFKSVFSKKKK